MDDDTEALSEKAPEVVQRGPVLALAYDHPSFDGWEDALDPDCEGCVVRRSSGHLSAFLKVSSSWMILTTPTGRKGVPSSPQNPYLPPTPTRWVELDPFGTPTDPTPKEIRKTERGWAGPGWTLEPHPVPRPDLRRWTWSVPGSWPWDSLYIHHRRTAAETHEWLSRLGPLPYERFDEDTLRHAGHGTLDRPSAQIRVEDHDLRFSERGPLASAREFNTGLVQAIAEGALGEVVWETRDGDFSECWGWGNDCASLAAHLDPRHSEEVLRERYERERRDIRREVDLRQARTRADRIAAFADAVAPGEAPTSAEAFGAWLREQPGPWLRAHWVVHVGDLDDDEFRWLVEFFRQHNRFVRLRREPPRGTG